MLLSITLLLFLMIMTVKRRERKRERSGTRSCRRFVVICPKEIRDVFLFCAWGFLILSFFLYFYYGIMLHKFDELYLSLSGFSLLIILVWMAATLWECKIEDNTMTYRTFYGLKKTAGLSDITDVKMTDHGSLVVYVDNHRFATLNSEAECLGNFKRLCEKQNISITPKARQTITKLSLYVSAMKPVFAVGIVVFVGSTILFAFLKLLSINVIVLLLFLSVFIIAIVSPVPFKGLYTLYQQERALCVDFNREMERYQTKGSEFTNETWFVRIDLCHVIVFHRNYIKEIQEIKQIDVAGENCMIYINNRGRICKIKAGRACLKECKEWLMTRRLGI